MAEDDKLVRWDPRDDDAWAERCARDRDAVEHQSVDLRWVIDEVVRRAVDGGALAVALTGSTARSARTAVSDLDLHVVGDRPYVLDLPSDLDVYASTPDRLSEKVRRGDDVGQWTLRFGCVLVDRGVLRSVGRMIRDEDLWPDGQTNLRRLHEQSRLAAELIEMGDRDAAHQEVRAVLTTYARARLLLSGVFPRARDELADQLVSEPALAAALHSVIHDAPDLDDLSALLALVGGAREVTARS